SSRSPVEESPQDAAPGPYSWLREAHHGNRLACAARGVRRQWRCWGPECGDSEYHAIGQAYARVANVTPKSGVKQVDRMLSNDGIDLNTVMSRWVQYVIGTHPSVVIAFDWTDFDRDDPTTLCAYLVTRHGRAMPLAWKTVKKSELAERQSELES